MPYLPSPNFYGVDTFTGESPIISGRRRYLGSVFIASNYPFASATFFRIPFAPIFRPPRMRTNPSGLEVDYNNFGASFLDLHIQIRDWEQRFRSMSRGLPPLEEEFSKGDSEPSTLHVSVSATPPQSEPAVDRDPHEGGHLAATTLECVLWVPDEEWRSSSAPSRLDDAALPFDAAQPFDAPQPNTDPTEGSLFPMTGVTLRKAQAGLGEAASGCHPVELEGLQEVACVVDAMLRPNPDDETSTALVDAASGNVISTVPPGNLSIYHRRATQRDTVASIVDAYSIDFGDEGSTIVESDEDEKDDKLVADIVLGAAQVADGSLQNPSKFGMDDSEFEDSSSMTTVDLSESAHDSKKLKTYTHHESALSLTPNAIVSISPQKHLSMQCPRSRAQDLLLGFGLGVADPTHAMQQPCRSPTQKHRLSWMDAASIAERAAGPQLQPPRMRDCMSMVSWTLRRWWDERASRRGLQVMPTWLGPTRPAAIMVDVTVERQ